MDQLSGLQLFAVWVLPVLFAITVHEVAHGWVASQFGDKTALMLGRLTLNPIKHIDPIGTIVVPGILLYLGGFIFGWAKPVPVNPNNLRRPRPHMALVALAGPVTNFIMALIWAAIAKIGIIGMQSDVEWMLALIYMGQAGIIINLILMILNLIPMPPLDGGRILTSLLPGRAALAVERIEPFGFFILIGLLATGMLHRVIAPPFYFLQALIRGIFQL